MKKYIITESRLKQLLYAEDRLEALEAVGVDNWDGFGEKQDLLFETIEEMEEAISLSDPYYLETDDFFTIDELLKSFEVYEENKERGK